MKSSFDATGEVLVVTGGANGIGAAVARGFVEAGGASEVLDVERSPAIDGVTQHKVDVSDRDAVFAAVAEMLARHGRIDGPR